MTRLLNVIMCECYKHLKRKKIPSRARVNSTFVKCYFLKLGEINDANLWIKEMKECLSQAEDEFKHWSTGGKRHPPKR